MAEHTGGMVALVPADPASLVVDGGDPPDQLHLTLAYLGDDVTTWTADEKQAVLAVAARLAAGIGAPIEARAMGHTTFNPDGGDDGTKEPCAVYMIGDSDQIVPLQADVVAAISAVVPDLPPQHSPFLPHVTAGYGLDASALTYAGPVTFDRLRVALADEVTDYPLGKSKKDAVTASADRRRLMRLATAPPRDWFADPGLDGPTALTVTADGQVFGHIAAFDVPHTGLDEVTTAPRSPSDYRYFRTGAVLTADGTQVPTGRITVGTGHADLEAGVTAAADHYDNTGTAVADVAVGEDEYGIWCAGSVRPGATPEQVHALRASPLSGDWRSVGGALDLVAALSVNVPGFPVPRSIAASGVPMALVAAGAVVAATTMPPGKKPAAAPKPPAPKPVAKKKPPVKKKPPAGGDFNSKHPRAASGGPTGGQFAPGPARSAEAAKSQKDPKAQAAYKALLAANPADRAKLLAGMKDADLEALSKLAYSFKSSDPKVVAGRIAIANQLAKRGKDVKSFGALGGGPARKAAVKKPAAAKKAAPKKPSAAKKPAAAKAKLPAGAAGVKQGPKGEVVLNDSVSDAQVAALMKAGWKGDPADKREALYPPKKKPTGAVVASSSSPTERTITMPVTFTDDEAVVLRDALGVAEDADPAAIMAAAAALSEHGDEAETETETDGEAEQDTAGAGTATALAASIPPGLKLVDEAQLAALVASARRGDEARAKQEHDERVSLVASAVADGRIPPVRRDHWIAQLKADPGAATVLASLAAGTVPVEPIGHNAASTPDPAQNDDYWFPGVVSTSREG